MTYPRIAVIAAAVVGLLIPAGAQARGPSYSQVVTRSQTIALAYWQDRGLTPCAPVSLTLDDDDQALAPGSLAFARPAPLCEVHVRSAARVDSPVRVCALLTHEYGHLAGLDHSPDPASVMHFDSSGTPAECASAWVPSCSKVQARRWTRRARLARSAGRGGVAHLLRRRAANCRFEWRAV